MELNKYLKINKNICSYPQSFDTEYFIQGGQIKQTPHPPTRFSVNVVEKNAGGRRKINANPNYLHHGTNPFDSIIKMH